jgi:hypothetical protein
MMRESAPSPSHGFCLRADGVAFARLRALALPLLIASGCGGTGPDGTPPTLTSRTPPPGEGNVSVHSAIEASFSEPLAASTVTASSVIVSGEGSILLPTTLTLSADGSTVAIGLDSAPSAPNTITVTLTDDISDRAGNRLNVPADVWSFEMPAWLALDGPLSAHDGDGDAYYPSLALDGNGNPTVAWEEFGESVWDIPVWRWDGSGWSPLGGGPLSANEGNTDAEKPSLALDASGDPVVAWHEDDGTTRNIHVHQWDGSVWNPVGSGLLSANGGNTNAFSPSLKLDDHDRPVVAWHEDDGTVYNVHVQRWDGSAWSPVGGGLLSRNGAGTDAGSPSLALDGSGNPVVAWHEHDGTTYNIYVQRWDGSAWIPLGSALSATSGITAALRASLALAESGDPLVAWQERKDAVLNIFVWRWDGGSWIPLGSGLSVNGFDALEPSLVLNDSGDPVVAWRGRESDGSTAGIHIWQWDGNDWSPVEGGRFSSVPESGFVEAPSLTVSPSGVQAIAWHETDGASFKIHVRRANE